MKNTWWCYIYHFQQPNTASCNPGIHPIQTGCVTQGESLDMIKFKIWSIVPPGKSRTAPILVQKRTNFRTKTVQNSRKWTTWSKICFRLPSVRRFTKWIANSSNFKWLTNLQWENSTCPELASKFVLHLFMHCPSNCQPSNLSSWMSTLSFTVTFGVPLLSIFQNRGRGGLVSNITDIKQTFLQRRGLGTHHYAPMDSGDLSQVREAFRIPFLIMQ